MVTLELMQFIGLMVSIIVGITGGAWAMVRYLIKRQDDGDNRLHNRIDEVREQSISRAEYEKDTNRLHADVEALKEEVRQQGRATTQRLDTLITNFIRGSDS